MAASILGLIGRTPAVRLERLAVPGGAEVWAKLESYSPGGSVKDRIALGMIEDAEASGALQPGQAVVEATSGNTGIGLALVCGVKGYPLTLVLPESMSEERLFAVRKLGAELALSPAVAGMAGSMHLANEIAEAKGAFMPRQFDNPANPATHERTTGPEIWGAAEGRLDAFVAAVGTGGTISGVGRYLKRRDPSVKVVAVEPAASPVLSGGQCGPHRIQGIGAGFVPATFDRSVVDDVVTVEDMEAYEMRDRLGAEEGLWVGLSAGAAAAAAIRVAATLPRGARVITLFPDAGDRYASLEPYFRL